MLAVRLIWSQLLPQFRDRRTIILSSAKIQEKEGCIQREVALTLNPSQKEAIPLIPRQLLGWKNKSSRMRIFKILVTDIDFISKASS